MIPQSENQHINVTFDSKGTTETVQSGTRPRSLPPITMKIQNLMKDINIQCILPSKTELTLNNPDFAYLHVKSNPNDKESKVVQISKKELSKHFHITEDELRDLKDATPLVNRFINIGRMEKQMYTMIEKSTLDDPQKDDLKRAATSLKEELLACPPCTRSQIYIMEGATNQGDKEVGGRKSTDADENIALKTIAQMTLLRGQTSVIALPDEGNVANTKVFLESLGVNVKEMPKDKTSKLDPGTIYLVATETQSSVDDLVELTSKDKGGRDVIVLGPPLGHAALLINSDTQKVTVQGLISIDESGTPKGGSTNTRDNASIPFLKALVEQKPNWKEGLIPSGIMVETINFKKFENLGGDRDQLFTKHDTEHWASNTEEQFLGAFSDSKNFKLPGAMLLKRLDKSGALKIFGGENAKKISEFMNQDPQKKVLGFERFFEAIQTFSPNTKADKSVIDGLVNGGLTHIDWNDDKKVKQFLDENIQAFKKGKAYQSAAKELDESLNKCQGLIENMSPDQRKMALAAIFMAFKNVYEEKTEGGWETAVKDNGNPLDFSKFKEAYNSDGKQVPYDPNAVLCAALGKQLNPAMAKQLLLLNALDLK